MKKITLYLLAWVALMAVATSCNKNEIEDAALSRPQTSENEGNEDGDNSSVNNPFVDNRVRILQKAEGCEGMNLVLMGDGFTRKDFESGYYDEIMLTSYEHLFELEPAKSLRKYFNVYLINVVSATNEFNGNTALGCTFEYDESYGDYNLRSDNLESLVCANVDIYASYVEGLDPARTVTGVVLNTEEWGGITTHISGVTANEHTFCTLTGGVTSDLFKFGWIHEVMGHGVAKLADEYNSGNSRANNTYLNQIKGWQKDHRYINVSTSKTDLPWQELIDCGLYTDEGLGCYQGACYYNNIYRPTDNSIMRNYDGFFNAPSRYAIYYWTMKCATGEEKSYQDFIKFEFPDYEN